VIALLLALAAADAPAMTPVEAERAFAADARTIGQWTAFRKWSTDDAVMFVPQPTNAHDFLKDRKDPPQAIDWWPTASWISCDGTLAVNTGGWKRPDGSVGYFSTVWQRQADGGWKWIVDGGDETKDARPRPASLTVVKAPCRKQPMPFVLSPETMRDLANGKLKTLQGHSADTSLNWIAYIYPDGRRHFSVALWNGKADQLVVRDEVTAPK
jgi:hypothetical protein